MKKYKSHLILDNIQIKSLNKARLFAKMLENIEEEICIWTTKITISNSFICPEIDLSKLINTNMELHLRDILIKLQ
jgi:hypothetical protein